MSAPAGMTDIQEYVNPDPSWAQENHLAIAGGGQPVCTWLDSTKKMLWDMKGLGGYPWDGNSYDEKYFYQSITEWKPATGPSSWTVPTMFKIFASKSWSGANGGIAWMPRYFYEGGFNAPIITPDSTYRIYTACGTFTVETLNGPIMTKVEGPYSKNFGGDLGVQNALVHSYFWGPGFVNMEKNYFVKSSPGQPSGHVQWEDWDLVNGVYVLNQTSAFNTVVPGILPVLNFPCGVPVIV